MLNVLRLRCGFVLAAAALVSAMLTASQPSSAQVLVTDRTVFAGTDFVDWGNAGANFSTPSNPFAISSNLGNSLSVSKASGGTFLRLNQGSGWSGNFAPGDELLFTNFASGPISISFSSLVAGAGAQIQRNAFGVFTASIQAFDSGNNSMGLFLLGGSSTSAGDNSAIFIGIENAAGGIARVEFNVTGGSDFSINQMDIKYHADAVPEGQSVALFAAGIPALWFGIRRRIRK